MLISRLWNYYFGYVIITVKGIKTEQFINLAVSNNIYLWDIKRLDYTTIRIKIGIKDFLKLRKIVRKTDTKICILKKCGLPFRIKSFRRRKLLVYGIGALLIFLYIISSYVWMIEIIGEKTISEDVILEELNDNGLKTGVLKSKVDKRYIENKVLVNRPELAWIGIEIKGTKAYVTVSEKIDKPEDLNVGEPCDIIAMKNAVIEKILVLNGDAVVIDGDTVSKGQLLVTGIIEREDMETRYVHSMAKVLAKTWYEDVEEIGFKQVEFKKTGRNRKIHEVDILGKRICISRKVPYKEFRKDTEEKYVFSFGNYIFPIKHITMVYYELKPIEKYLTAEEAKKRCFERLNQKIKLQYPENGVMLDKRIEYFVNKESIIGKIYIEVIEDIAKKKMIDMRELILGG